MQGTAPRSADWLEATFETVADCRAAVARLRHWIATTPFGASIQALAEPAGDLRVWYRESPIWQDSSIVFNAVAAAELAPVLTILTARPVSPDLSDHLCGGFRSLFADARASATHRIEGG